VLSQRYDNAQQTRLSHCPVDLENLIEAFEDLKAGGTTILMVEQNVRFAERPGDTVAVMDNGRVVHEGSMEHLPGMTVLSIPRSLAVSANRDYQPLAIVAVIALASFALIGSPATWLTPTIAGLAMGMILVLAASGLMLVFGLMDVLNFGHGMAAAKTPSRRSCQDRTPCRTGASAPDHGACGSFMGANQGQSRLRFAVRVFRCLPTAGHYPGSKSATAALRKAASAGLALGLPAR
jgi:hypothetical protein